MKQRYSILMFLIGLGSITQFHFVGSLGLSEFPIFLFAPVIFIQDYKKLKQDGFLPFVWLTILTCISCVISSYVNKTPQDFFIKGMAHPYALFAATVVFHKLLRNNFDSLKWYIIGAFLSSVISIFIFQQETFIVASGDVAAGVEATRRVISNPLFWSGKIKSLLMLPVTTSYLSFHPVCSGAIAAFAGVVSLVMSGNSGRAGALIMFITAFLFLIGGRSRLKMKKMGQHLILFGIMVAVLLGLFKLSYSWLAKNGHLGYDAQEKYLAQTRMGDSALAILMAGRMELFCGVMACMDRPLIGFGPKGEDTNGYVERYLSKYGTPEDYQTFVNVMYERRRRGLEVYIPIPSHSYISFFWVYYGIVGLILWLYVLWLCFKYLRSYAQCIPQWYGFIAFSIASFFWNVFFSAFDARITVPAMISCVLFARAVYEQKAMLPAKMEAEARKSDGKI